MIYSVKCSPAVATTRQDGSGQRVRTIEIAGDKKPLAFSRYPLYLTSLPEEVAGDHQLIVKKLKEAPSGAYVLDLKTGESYPVDGQNEPERRPPGAVDYEKMSYKALQKLAKDRGLEASGKTEELVERLQEDDAEKKAYAVFVSQLSSGKPVSELPSDELDHLAQALALTYDDDTTQEELAEAVADALRDDLDRASDDEVRELASKVGLDVGEDEAPEDIRQRLKSERIQ